jgi:arabinose-5-phosphate isomerase
MEYPSETGSVERESVTEARRVLRVEAEALVKLAEDLPADFEAAVAMILACRGRVVVCGIGKSGHIGRKISATLASTGTPSHFVHASEASHGDMGVIAADDVCLLISNSGETAEMRDVVLYTRRFSIPMIAISSNPDSSLMAAADLCLTLPRMPEACAIGKAPTTSTTMTLALGDALAVALMRLRGFASEDFHVFHPGGKLGAQMSTVAELMHTGDQLPLVAADTPMSEALLEMTSKGFGMAGVTDATGRLAGVISDGDLRRNMDNLMARSAIEIANRDPVTVAPDCLAAQALALLNARKIGALIAVDADRRPIGVLHVHDCLRAGVV